MPGAICHERLTRAWRCDLQVFADNKEVESMGARVLSQYAVLGGYDFVNIIEAPTNEVMSLISMELGSRGTIKVTTLPGMEITAFVDMLQGKSTGGS